jgi:hypothetical protein
VWDADILAKSIETAKCALFPSVHARDTTNLQIGPDGSAATLRARPVKRPTKWSPRRDLVSLCEMI